MSKKVINLLGVSPKKVILRRVPSKIKNKYINVVMMPITALQESRIDKSKNYYGEIKFDIDNNRFIMAKDIYLYGEVDFENESDLDSIEKFKLINDEGGWVYSNFDFDNGNYTVIDNQIKGYYTYDVLLWFMFNYVRLGKPKRIIVFNEEYYRKK